MKPNKEAGELQITGLEQVEIHHPLLALQSFTEDFSLASIRQLIATMRDVCITTENAFFGDAGTREDLLHVTKHLIRFMEAGYLYVASQGEQAAEAKVRELSTLKPGLAPKFLRVRQRLLPSTNGTEPYRFPVLTLYGQWLEKAGFRAGDEVKLILQRKKILIVNLEWDEDRKAA